jgi:quinol monooxygenase YgiN
MDDTIVLVARIKAKPEAVEAVKAAALAIVAASRGEAGCINYDVHQGTDDETIFVWHETWASKQAIDAHFATAHFAEFSAAIEKYAAEPPQITLTRMISDRV